MNPNLKHAILEFLANEYHLEMDTVDEDVEFATDLNLKPEEITELLGRLQDALDFTLPEEHIAEVDSVGDIIRLLESEASEIEHSSPE